MPVGGASSFDWGKRGRGGPFFRNAGVWVTIGSGSVSPEAARLAVFVSSRLASSAKSLSVASGI